MLATHLTKLLMLALFAVLARWGYSNDCRSCRRVSAAFALVILLAIMLRGKRFKCARKSIEEILMRNFVIGLVLILAGIVGLGLYRGYIRVSSDKAPDKPSVTVTVDKEKMQDDKNKAVEAAQTAKDKAMPTTEKSKG